MNDRSVRNKRNPALSGRVCSCRQHHRKGDVGSAVREAHRGGVPRQGVARRGVARRGIRRRLRRRSARPGTLVLNAHVARAGGSRRHCRRCLHSGLPCCTIHAVRFRRDRWVHSASTGRLIHAGLGRGANQAGAHQRNGQEEGFGTLFDFHFDFPFDYPPDNLQRASCRLAAYRNDFVIQTNCRRKGAAQCRALKFKGSTGNSPDGTGMFLSAPQILLAPEQHEKNDDRDGDAKHPQQRAFAPAARLCLSPLELPSHGLKKIDPSV